MTTYLCELQHPKLLCLASPNDPRYQLTNFHWNLRHSPSGPNPDLLYPSAAAQTCAMETNFMTETDDASWTDTLTRNWRSCVAFITKSNSTLNFHIERSHHFEADFISLVSQHTTVFKILWLVLWNPIWLVLHRVHQITWFYAHISTPEWLYQSRCDFTWWKYGPSGLV